MRNMKLSLMLLFALCMAAFLNGCGSSSKSGAAQASYGTVAKIDETACRTCHSSALDKVGNPIVANYLSSPHNRDDVGCQGCHGGGSQHNGVGPLPYMASTASESCKNCHLADGTISTANSATAKAVGKGATYSYKFGGSATIATNHTKSGGYFAKAGGSDKCGTCHGAHNPLQFSIPTTITTLSLDCLECHAVNRNTGNGKYVNDNNGVRAITTEFNKWSHHVTGVTVNSAHCAACHLEGTVKDGAIVVDTTKHMVDNKTHLRNADTDADLLWDPATPAHENMDNFCMSCHDSGGATSTVSVLIQKFINDNTLAATGNTASATNPFGDTISNQYDKMMRGRVVNVADQFVTDNVSHHAVKGKKYSGRVSTAGDPRSITSPTTFSANKNLAKFANGSSTQGEFAGERVTIYEAGRFVDTYKTLSPAKGEDYTLGDDSVLHCGDCHTVGQWKPGSSVNADGSATTVAIGAHGSTNEYMLRNSIGTDQLHRGAQYNYSPTNMLGGLTTSPINLGSTAGSGGVAGNFAGMKFGEFPTGLPRVTANLTNQAVPATEVPTAQPFLVCYNCHVYTEYGSIYFSNTAQGGREGSHAYGDHTRGNYCNGPYNTSGSGRAASYTEVYGQKVTGTTGTFMGVTGFNVSRLNPGVASTYTDGVTAADTAAVWWSATVANSLYLKTQGTGYSKVYDLTTGALAIVDANGSGATAGATKSSNSTTQLAFQGMNGSNAGSGNIFQIQCINCHNSGPANGFGGIHGSKINTYTDAAGQTSKARRFLPGLGNVKWVPGDKKGTEAQQWEQEANLSYTSGTNQAGCYTLTTSTSAAGYNAALPATSEGGTTTGTGKLFGTWGGCTDHSSVDGLERTMIRPVTY